MSSAADSSAAANEWARKRREQTERARLRRAEQLGVREEPREADRPPPLKSELDQLHELGDRCETRFRCHCHGLSLRLYVSWVRICICGF